MSRTDRRREAMSWWNKLNSNKKSFFARLYYERDFRTLTGREIEIIFEDEN